MTDTKWTYKEISILFGLFICQWSLFSAFVEREVSWSPFLNADAVWYLSHTYIVFNDLIANGQIANEFLVAPHGILPLLISALLYLLFGASRLLALSQNLFLFLAFQAVTYYAIARITKSSVFALAGVGFILVLQIPFQVNDNYMLNMMEFQREFLVFSLIGIYVWVVILSDTFKRLPASLVAGVIAGITIDFRYVMFFHIGASLAVIGVVLLVCYLFRRSRQWLRDIQGLDRFRNMILSGFTTLAVCAYPLYLARSAMFSHYFKSKIGEHRDDDLIAIYQQGVQNLTQQIRYYPDIIAEYFLGNTFFSLYAIVFGVLIVAWLCTKFHKAVEQIEQPLENKINFPLAYLFSACFIVVPLFMLTFYPTRSGAMGSTVVPVVVVILLLTLIHLYNLFCAHITSLTMNWLPFIIALITLATGSVHQVKAYSLAGLSTVSKRDYLTISKLYDDIITASDELRTTTPAVACDFVENYVLGCAQGITAYDYEHNRQILRPQCIFPTDIGIRYDYDSSVSALGTANIAILSLHESPIEEFHPRHRDPMSIALSAYPFPKSIEPFRSQLHSYVQENFRQVGTYLIFNRKIGLFKLFSPKPINVVATSVGGPGDPAAVLFGDKNQVWHSAVYPQYPQTIEFSYKEQLMVKGLTLSAQTGGVRRAPASFTFQGLDKKGDWQTLIQVEQVIYASNENANWPIATESSHADYRIIITANNGAEEFVTLRKIALMFDTKGR